MKLFSYDIFDTCLVRTCGEPKHVFDMLATRILGERSNVSERIDFSLIRMRAETEARKTLINEINEEVTLEDIYSFCDFSRLTSTDKKTIMQTELEIEEFVLLPIERTRAEIELLVKQGANVVYISDMYLPKSFIEKLLIRYGFYVNQNIYVSSDIKKSKETGHLYDHVSNDLNINSHHWKHTGDNFISDYKIPKSKGISANLAKHDYTKYESMGKKIMLDGSKPNNSYAFSLSRAIRLSSRETPNTIFASTFIAPMFVSYVYKILCDSQNKGINHLFFIARDGYILYHIALEFAKQFPNIKLSYLYASRQALYLVGLNELTPCCVMEYFPHLKNKNIESILYELHLPSYDYSKHDFSGLKGEQIIELLFKDKTFVDKLSQKYQEQDSLVAKYFKQEGLNNGHCATVDVVGSRRCQRAINNILVRHKCPPVFSYYFEVTSSRITDYEPYLAMNYQENVIKSPFYNRASQPLYEQFFAITDQRRTIEYVENQGIIEPILESDYIDELYKKKIFEINKSICLKYAKHYIHGCGEDPIVTIQTAQKVFAFFCYVPDKQHLLAIESFRCTGSGEPNEVLLNKRNFLYTITHINKFFRWPEGQLIYSSGWLYPLILLILKKRYKIKTK